MAMAIAPTGEDEVVIITSDNQLLKSQINFDGNGELEELAPNLEATKKIVGFIKENIGSRDFLHICCTLVY